MVQAWLEPQRCSSSDSRYSPSNTIPRLRKIQSRQRSPWINLVVGHNFALQVEQDARFA